MCNPLRAPYYKVKRVRSRKLSVNYDKQRRNMLGGVIGAAFRSADQVAGNLALWGFQVVIFASESHVGSPLLALAVTDAGAGVGLKTRIDYGASRSERSCSTTLPSMAFISFFS